MHPSDLVADKIFHNFTIGKQAYRVRKNPIQIDRVEAKLSFYRK